MDKVLKIKEIIERKREKNQHTIATSVEEIAQLNRELNHPDITVRKHEQIKYKIHSLERNFHSAADENKVLMTVLMIIDNVINGKEGE